MFGLYLKIEINNREIFDKYCGCDFQEAVNEGFEKFIALHNAIDYAEILVTIYHSHGDIEPYIFDSDFWREYIAFEYFDPETNILKENEAKELIVKDHYFKLCYENDEMILSRDDEKFMVPLFEAEFYKVAYEAGLFSEKFFKFFDEYRYH